LVITIGSPSKLERSTISITKPTGSSIIITCDIQRETNYIHWYQLKERNGPQHLLYYDHFISQPVVDTGLSSGKYHAYEGTEKSCKFVLRNLDENDSGVYYCAIWTGTVIQTCPYLY
jgi:hypothetical protein